MLRPIFNRKIPVKIVKVKLSKDVKHFSVWHLLTFALVFAGIGGLIIWHSFAATPTDTDTDTDTANQTPLATNIDTSNQSAVESAYYQLWNPAQSTKPDWTGSVKNCDPGTMSATAISREIDALNFVRRMEHLAPLRAANSLTNANDMKTALLEEANSSHIYDPGVSPHFPPKTWKCWTQAGYNAAGASDLSFGPGTVGGHVGSLIDDSGYPGLGHRLSLLDPILSAVGIGTSATVGVIQAYNVPTNNLNPRPDTMWPVKGYFPSTLAPESDWSYTIHNNNIGFSKATLSVTHNGAAITVKKIAADWVNTGPSLAWAMPSNYKASGDYTVNIKHIYNKHKKIYTTRSYTVHFYPIQPTLRLVKNVDNSHGGTKTPHDWTLTATGKDGFSDRGDSTAFHKVDLGVTYSLSESNVPGYTAITYYCTNGGDFSQTGNTVKLSAGQNVTCTITNLDIAPRLTVIKKVVNSHSGTKYANAFSVKVNGITLTGGSLFNGNLYEQYNYSNPIANTSYTVSENQLNGYSQTSLNCVDNHTSQVVANPVNLSLGQYVTCTITNSDQ